MKETSWVSDSWHARESTALHAESATMRCECHGDVPLMTLDAYNGPSLVNGRAARGARVLCR